MGGGGGAEKDVSYRRPCKKWAVMNNLAEQFLSFLSPPPPPFVADGIIMGIVDGKRLGGLVRTLPGHDCFFGTEMLEWSQMRQMLPEQG